jgi:hypothetical protein
MATVQGRLADSTPIKHEIKLAIIGSLWPRCPPAQLDSLGNFDWTPYFNYYVSQCHHSLQGQPVASHTHQDIVKVSTGLRKNFPREKIEEQLRNAIKDFNAKKRKTSSMEEMEESLSNTINLVARLFLMVNVGDSKVIFTTGRTKLQWTHGPLNLFLLDNFQPAKSLKDVGVGFEKTFTARNIERIAGITIQWTDNLADHLRMLDAEDKTVAIFH